ncbi:hypothetical protein [Peribacillus glennii]|uniref:Uncharacterized protein n=1 Tax=Peribacillus glennii TaxID=2303991 RepID=A0A372L7X4_9BACI|nr:hypothetical protein [Peribacillus glennii]RFU60865.1 hypothetical protein D0466_19995 [Peribacillus glennii]
MNRLDKGDKIGPLIVESVKKDNAATTFTFTGDLKNVKGFYDLQTGQFFYKQYGFKDFKNGKAILVKNQSQLNELLQGQNGKLTGTLSSIQVTTSGNNFTVQADLNNVQLMTEQLEKR